MTVDTTCVNGEIKRCPTCHLVKDGKISEEKIPLCLLDEVDPKVWYCKTCGYLYVIDEDGFLDGIININENLLFPKLRSIVFGLDTLLHKAVKDILTEIREDEHLDDKNRKLCAVN
jgi:rubredoxin